jgi:hypothetical protein
MPTIQIKVRSYFFALAEEGHVTPLSFL